MTVSDTDPSEDQLELPDVWAAALAQAAQAVGVCEPNPRVGCVILGGCGSAWQGHTQAAGGHHAEIAAIAAAQSQGAQLAGATAYVTLEPCSHFGRTPPCCDALVAAGIGKVVVATKDPNPLVAGRGIDRLRAAGVEVVLLPTDHPAAQKAREINIGFFSRMIRATPWVRMKMASSLDGTTALTNGISQWITSEPARIDGHHWRARACAVLTGIGTVLEDDPMLDVRLAPATRQPHLIIVDSRLETPPSARLFQPAAHGLPRQVWIYCAQPDAARQTALEARGAHVRCMPDLHGKVDLRRMLRDLAQREVNELHLEAGFKLNGSLLKEGLVDECLLYLAPTLLGQGAGLANFGPLNRLDEGLALSFHSVELVGVDLRVLARGVGRDDFLND